MDAVAFRIEVMRDRCALCDVVRKPRHKKWRYAFPKPNKGSNKLNFLEKRVSFCWFCLKRRRERIYSLCDILWPLGEDGQRPWTHFDR